MEKLSDGDKETLTLVQADKKVNQTRRPVVSLFENGKLTPSPVAPATGRLYRLSARRQVPAGRSGISRRARRQINSVKLATARDTS